MKNSFDGRLIGFLSSLVSDWEQTSPAATASTRTACLTRDAVMRLEKSSGVKGLEIKSGTVWLTSTPSSGDVLLEKGQRFETAGDWPYVIQALEPGQIILLMQSDSEA